jgi:hypothetical protein
MTPEQREKRRAYMQTYREANKERLQERERAYNRVYYEANKERIQELQKTYREANKELRKVYFKTYRYGLSPEYYNTLLDAQEFLCSICSAPDLEDGRPLYVDHDHETRRIRGLLCQKCNTGLGMFRDTPEYLERAARYLYHQERISRGELE